MLIRIRKAIKMHDIYCVFHENANPKNDYVTLKFYFNGIFWKEKGHRSYRDENLKYVNYYVKDKMRD